MEVTPVDINRTHVIVFDGCIRSMVEGDIGKTISRLKEIGGTHDNVAVYNNIQHLVDDHHYSYTSCAPTSYCKMIIHIGQQFPLYILTCGQPRGETFDQIQELATGRQIEFIHYGSITDVSEIVQFVRLGAGYRYFPTSDLAIDYLEQCLTRVDGFITPVFDTKPRLRYYCPVFIEPYVAGSVLGSEVEEYQIYDRLVGMVGELGTGELDPAQFGPMIRSILDVVGKKDPDSNLVEPLTELLRLVEKETTNHAQILDTVGSCITQQPTKDKVRNLMAKTMMVKADLTSNWYYDDDLVIVPKPTEAEKASLTCFPVFDFIVEKSSVTISIEQYIEQLTQIIKANVELFSEKDFESEDFSKEQRTIHTVASYLLTKTIVAKNTRLICAIAETMALIIDRTLSPKITDQIKPLLENMIMEDTEGMNLFQIIDTYLVFPGTAAELVRASLTGKIFSVKPKMKTPTVLSELMIDQVVSVINKKSRTKNGLQLWEMFLMYHRKEIHEKIKDMMDKCLNKGLNNDLVCFIKMYQIHKTNLLLYNKFRAMVYEYLVPRLESSFTHLPIVVAISEMSLPKKIQRKIWLLYKGLMKPGSNLFSDFDQRLVKIWTEQHRSDQTKLAIDDKAGVELEMGPEPKHVTGLVPSC